MDYTNNNGGQSSNNSSFQANRINTTGITLFDNESMMLRMSYLGETLSMMIATPFVGDNGKKSYPDSNRHSILLTADRAAVLYNEVILKGVLPAVEAKQDFVAGVFLNRKKESILQLRVQDGEIYLVLLTNINQDRVAENSYVFHFQKTEMIYGYDASGSFDSQEEAEGVFFLFCKWLDEGLASLTSAAGHSMRKANDYSQSQIFNYLKGIAAKLGVTIENGYRRQSNGYNNQAPNPGFMQIPEGAGEEIPFDDTPTAGAIDDLIS